MFFFSARERERERERAADKADGDDDDERHFFFFFFFFFSSSSLLSSYSSSVWDEYAAAQRSGEGVCGVRELQAAEETGAASAAAGGDQ